MNIDRGVRASSAYAILRPAMRRPNLRVLTRCHVHAVLFDGERVPLESSTGGTAGLSARAVRAGGHPLRRRVRLSPAPAALRHRAGGRIEVVGDSGPGGPAGSGLATSTTTWRFTCSTSAPTRYR